MKLPKLFLLFLIMTIMGVLPYLYFWFHPILVSGLNPLIGWAIALVLLVLIFPLMKKGYRRGKQNRLKENSREPQILFFIGGVSMIFVWLIAAHSTLDLHFHDTYYIIGRQMVTQGIFLTFGFFSLIYFVFLKCYRLSLNLQLARIHFWVTFVILNIGLALYTPAYTNTLPGILPL